MFDYSLKVYYLGMGAWKMSNKLKKAKKGKCPIKLKLLKFTKGKCPISI